MKCTDCNSYPCEKVGTSCYNAIHKDERDISALKKAIVEVLDTGFESSERDMVLVLDRIDAWEKGELRSKQGVSRDEIFCSIY
jgi:hypothetical protein